MGWKRIVFFSERRLSRQNTSVLISGTHLILKTHKIKTDVFWNQEIKWTKKRNYSTIRMLKEEFLNDKFVDLLNVTFLLTNLVLKIVISWSQSVEKTTVM